jgi:hypothetical protein
MKRILAIMKRTLTKGIAVITVASLCISCFSFRRDGQIKYPTEIKKTLKIEKNIENIAPEYYSVIDIHRMKVYSLGDYYLVQSILFGPSGRASNYHHYLLTDKTYSRQIGFMSLSPAINNIWIDGDTMFVDLLDFVDEAYYNDEYANCDKCNFILRHNKLIASSFVLDIITEEEVCLGWKELEMYSRH